MTATGAHTGADLRIEGVAKSFGQVHVLADVSLTVGSGEIVSLVGPSGSGKSTLLNILTGATIPDAGVITYAGAPLSSAGQPFALMPQTDALLPWRRATANAAIGLEVAGVPKRQARARAAGHFADFGLAGAEESWPRQLSGGMRQRVSFLRAVIQDRPMLLLDEPFGALDAITRELLHQWLLSMWAQHQWTILFITHDIREAVRLSDRVYVLSDKPARVAGRVSVPRTIARGDGFYSDPAGGLICERVHALLRA